MRTWQRTICRLALAVMFSGVFLLSIAKSVQAKTTLTDQGDCLYKLTVSLVLNFEQIETQEALIALNRWEKATNDYWGKKNGAKNFAAGCRLEPEFIFKKMTKRQTCADYPEDHCFHIVAAKANQRGNLADTLLVKPNSQTNSWGEWSLTASGSNIAHEVGHLMGLTDEYHYEKIKSENLWFNENIKEYGPQSLMAQTWGSVAVFPEHITKIFEQAGYGQQYALAILPKENYKISLSEQVNLETAQYYLNKAGKKVYSDRISPQLLSGQLVRNESDNAVYFVSEAGKLRWISSDSRGQEVFGKNWREKALWFNDAILFTYTFDDQL